MLNKELHIEALIFSSEQSLRVEEIAYCLQASLETDVSIEDINQCILNIQHKYSAKHLAIELVKVNNGYQFLTKKEFHPVINLLQAQRSKKKLSQAALETLAVIAYRQPATKTDVEQIRGVNCDYSIQKLLEKELIAIVGKSEAVGKPILYGTSGLFMEYFGINSMNDLPHIKELTTEESSIGDVTE
ncbi:SMC-Scp complex subunit ScpB [Mucilaginibacter sp.]